MRCRTSVRPVRPPSISAFSSERSSSNHLVKCETGLSKQSISADGEIRVRGTNKSLKCQLTMETLIGQKNGEKKTSRRRKKITLGKKRKKKNYGASKTLLAFFFFFSSFHRDAKVWYGEVPNGRKNNIWGKRRRKGKQWLSHLPFSFIPWLADARWETLIGKYPERPSSSLSSFIIRWRPFIKQAATVGAMWCRDRFNELPPPKRNEKTH